jgi:hypothetical protein
LSQVLTALDVSGILLLSETLVIKRVSVTLLIGEKKKKFLVRNAPQMFKFARLKRAPLKCHKTRPLVKSQYINHLK